MKIEQGNIWDYHPECWLVITTNIGWKKNGANPMGAGIAREAASRFQDLPMIYGERCKKYGATTAVWPFRRGKLILFPTKPLNEEQPWLSWKSDSSYVLIERSAKQLAKVVCLLREQNPVSRVMLPLVGCGNGNLEPKRVIQILEQYLDNTFVLLEN